MPHKSSNPNTVLKRNFETIKFIIASNYYTLLRKPFIIKLFGLKYKRSQRRIEIDLTYSCQLRCFNCNRSCRQAPGEDRITIEQIKKFTQESVSNNIRWARIRLLGGEPTLHPDILEILDLILDYKLKFSPFSNIELITNGFGEKTNQILLKIPKGIKILNSLKNSPGQLFSCFNLAPVDNCNYKDGDYVDGCVNYSSCGMGLNTYGYYCCGNAGGMDRVFGFDIGRKRLPTPDDTMIDQLRVFCKICGIFTRFKLTRKELISITWQRAYEKFQKEKPHLELY